VTCFWSGVHRPKSTSEQDASKSMLGLYLTLWMAALWLYFKRPWPVLFQITTTLSAPPSRKSFQQPIK
jgi:hypothetical protein